MNILTAAYRLVLSRTAQPSLTSVFATKSRAVLALTQPRFIESPNTHHSFYAAFSNTTSEAHSPRRLIVAVVLLSHPDCSSREMQHAKTNSNTSSRFPLRLSWISHSRKSTTYPAKTRHTRTQASIPTPNPVYPARIHPWIVSLFSSSSTGLTCSENRSPSTGKDTRATRVHPTPENPNRA